MSDFAVQDRGGSTDQAMVFFAVAAGALIGALRPRPLVTVLLGLFGVAMVTAAVAPTDFGVVQLSMTGHIHRYASMIAFIVLPIAALMIRPSRGVRVAVAVTTVFMLAMLASATLGDRVLIGLAERLLLAGEVMLMVALAWPSHVSEIGSRAVR